MRSRTGCLTCRQRKLKCDEKKPICGQCAKGSRDCVPSTGIVFRHQHNASMNGEQTADENKLKGFFAYKDTFGDDTVWVDTPNQVSFVHFDASEHYTDTQAQDEKVKSPVSMFSSASLHNQERRFSFMATTLNPEADVSPSGVVPAVANHPTEGEPTISQGKTPTNAFPLVRNMATPILPAAPLEIDYFHSTSRDLASTLSPIDPQILSPATSSRSHVDSPNSNPQNLEAQPSFDTQAEQDHEIAFLLRWFSEGPGNWMDLFDLGRYFASYVPVKAQRNPLLKYAALAYSAKSLARIQGRKPITGGNVTRPGRSELYLDAHSVDWSHKAAQYYDRAVSLLLQTLKDGSATTPRPGSNCESPAIYDRTDGPEGPVYKRRRMSTVDFRSNTDELVAASAILSVYEFLDASGPEWAKHLNGAKSLLVIAQERMMPLQPGSPLASSNVGFISKARRATFWNIARQDMLAAFINKTHTRLDTEDLAIWKQAGLRIDEHGFIVPSNTADSGYPEGPNMMKEDLISNALVWLMSKLVNFIAASPNANKSSSETRDLNQPSWAITNAPQPTATAEISLEQHCHSLTQQFSKWHAGLPLTFQPCARIQPSHRLPTHSSLPSDNPHTDTGDTLLFPETWFSIPMCASTMQCYHMSQILLLKHNPRFHESPQLTSQSHPHPHLRTSSSPSSPAEAAAYQSHAREIISISLSRPEDAVRIHSTQPLFTAGQCLQDPREREIVLRLLREVERDVGWATEYRVRELLRLWEC